MLSDKYEVWLRDKYEVCFWISGHITLVGSSEHINRDAGTRGKKCNLQINFGRKNGTKDTENWNGTLIRDQLRSTWKQRQTLSSIYNIGYGIWWYGIASEKHCSKSNKTRLTFNLGIWRGKFLLNVPFYMCFLDSSGNYHSNAPIIDNLFSGRV